MKSEKWNSSIPYINGMAYDPMTTGAILIPNDVLVKIRETRPLTYVEELSEFAWDVLWDMLSQLISDGNVRGIHSLLRFPGIGVYDFSIFFRSAIICGMTSEIFRVFASDPRYDPFDQVTMGLACEEQCVLYFEHLLTKPGFCALNFPDVLRNSACNGLIITLMLLDTDKFDDSISEEFLSELMDVHSGDPLLLRFLSHFKIQNIT